MTEPRISWPHRIVAILIADATALVVWLVGFYVILYFGGRPPGQPPAIKFILYIWWLIAGIGLLPSLFAIWWMLRQSFPSLRNMMVAGTLVSLFVLVAYSQTLIGPSARMLFSALIVSFWTRGIVAILASGALGGAAAWAYLNWVRKRNLYVASL